MKFFLVLAVIAAALIWGGYYGLQQVGLIDAGCPSVSASRSQIVVDNKLPINIRLRLYDATTEDFRIAARQCLVFDVVRLKVAAETWEFEGAATPNCVTNLFAAQKLMLYERGDAVYCDVGRADIDTP